MEVAIDAVTYVVFSLYDGIQLHFFWKGEKSVGMSEAPFVRCISALNAPVAKHLSTPIIATG